MFKKIFEELFQGKKEIEEPNFIVATLNDKIMPIDRGDIYEDPLDEFLSKNNWGEISGGGTYRRKVAKYRIAM